MNKTIIALLTMTLTALFSGLGFYAFNQTSNGQSVPTPVADLWAHWKEKFHKKYGSEEQYRLQVFYSNYKVVMKHQADPERTFDMGFTEFMDLTPEEFKAKYLGTFTPKEQSEVTYLKGDKTPSSVDWRNQGVITPVKNQGQCGSCWAFSTTGSLEALSALSHKGLQSFSEQELVDCSTSYGNQGCNGGLMDYAFEYVKAHGITTESKYPYKGYNGKCRAQGGAFTIGSYHDVPEKNTAQLETAVAQQPVSVAVDASLSWQLYSGGVLRNCGKSLDHGVLLVGYTSEYWIVKNSWGGDWGEKGYIRLAKGNTCGIEQSASYPRE